MDGRTRRIVREGRERSAGKIDHDPLHETWPPTVQWQPPKFTLPRAQDVGGFNPQQAVRRKHSNPFCNTPFPVENVLEERIGKDDVKGVTFKRQVIRGSSLIPNREIPCLRSAASVSNQVCVKVNAGDPKSARMPEFCIQTKATAHI